MLKDEDRIFQNLYNDESSDLVSSKKRGDWANTKDLVKKGRDWIVNEIKISENENELSKNQVVLGWKLSV